MKGRKPAPKSPQRKQAESYAHDRRNDYGENVKAARRLIPLQKALSLRRDRRRVRQGLGGLPRLDEMEAAVVESSARRDVTRGDRWRKSRDRPLGDWLARRAAYRAVRIKPANST